jgi:Protein of unknown function (DUF2934)
MAKPTEHEIRTRAHELWEQAGKPEGREDEFWHLAERDLQEKPERSDTTILPG